MSVAMSQKTKPKTKSPSSVEDMSFEFAFQELEDIVRQLEAGQLPLDEALALFERGQALAARCQTVLETAQLKVQALTPSGLQTFEGEEA
jgi:exodeoxyribonuclease VII small subunit